MSTKKQNNNSIYRKPVKRLPPPPPISIQEELEFRQYEFGDFVMDMIERDDEEILQDGERLFLPDTPVDKKKEILFSLAHVTETEESRNIIANYILQAEPELRGWSALSLGEWLNHRKFDEDNDLL